MWTFVGGDAEDPIKINFANKIWNGRWSPAAIIDDDDRAWIFGGQGTSPDQSTADDWGDMWSFDTKTLTWRVEWGNESSFLTNSSLAVPGEYNSNNYPRARTEGFMVDRQDDTLLVGGGYGSNTNVWANDFWLFNKTSKMWKHVYGSLGDGHVPTASTHYRAPGSVFGSRANSGAGANNDCDVNADCSSSTSSTTDFLSHTCTCKEGYTGDGNKCTLSPPISNPSSMPTSLTPSSEPVGQQGPIRSTPQPSKVSSTVAITTFSAFTYICVALLAQ